MSNEFDQLLFLISTDCLANELFSGVPQRDVAALQKAARHALRDIVAGGNSYYLYADLSPARVLKTQRAFIAEAQALQGSLGILHKIGLLHDAMRGVTVEISTACTAVGCAAVRMYWLDTDHLKIPIPDQLVDLIAMIEPLGVVGTFQGMDLEGVWLNSLSCWDQQAMTLLEGIAPYDAFQAVTYFSEQFCFLTTWKKALGEARFSILKDFIQAEAHATLDLHTPAAAREIDRVMLAI